MPSNSAPLGTSLALQIFQNIGNMIYRFENQKIVMLDFLFFQDKNSRRKNHGFLKKHIGFKTVVLDGVLNLICNAKIIGEKFGR